MKTRTGLRIALVAIAVAELGIVLGLLELSTISELIAVFGLGYELRAAQQRES